MIQASSVIDIEFLQYFRNKVLNIEKNRDTPLSSIEVCWLFGKCFSEKIICIEACREIYCAGENPIVELEELE